MKLSTYVRVFSGLFFALNFMFSLAPFSPELRAVCAEARPPTAEDVYEMMKKLTDPGLTGMDKKRLTAVIFVHQDVFRKAVINRKIKIEDSDAYVRAFLEAKKEMQEYVARRMNAIYYMKTGKNLKAPVIPFGYKNIHSDDDLITGSGKVGKMMEDLYAEALDQHIKEHAMRPMTEMDRHRVDVNGLAWNMTQEGALENFWHKEKYINPQSGYANQMKLSEDPNLKVLTFDDNGRMKEITGEEAKKMILALDVDKPLEIPGVDAKRGTGSMSDYLRIAEIHQVKFTGGVVTEEDIAKFIRNQKYTERIDGDFQAVAAKDNPMLAKELDGFNSVSAKIRTQITAEGVAKLLQEEYKIPIIDSRGVVDLEKLTEAMKMHQNKQLTLAMPQMIGAVQANEAYKIAQWIKGEPMHSPKRRALRKQLAITYAPHDPEKIKKIADTLDHLDIPDDEKKWLKSVIENDSKQIYRYCTFMDVPPERMAKAWKMDGPNTAIVDIIESDNVKSKALSDALDAKSGGLKFKEFLKSKTAQALNLDTMLDGTREEKLMSWSMMIVAATRAYSAAQNETEGMKAVGMAMFEMVPFVSATLRFSEDEFHESFKELAMDIFPPLGLANLAGTVFHYAAMTAKDSFTETVWEGLVREAMRDLSESDFEGADAGYYRLKNRASYLEYLKEIAPGMGRVAKLASLVEPEIEARMSRHPDVKNNEAALYTILRFEGVKVPESASYDPQSTVTHWATKQFANAVNKWLTGLSVEQLRKRVYEQGLLKKGEGSNVERVAAKIILDNLSIRADVNTEVLEDFIDRIEKYYNDAKGQLKANCDTRGLFGQMVEAVAGPADRCEPIAIIQAALDVIREDFEGAAEIRKSPWGLEKLTEEYNKRVAYLKDYQPSSGTSELDLRKHLQEVIDGFRKAIEKLEVAVVLYEEKKYLNLEAFVYGGKDSRETAELLMGDEFSVGIQATVHPRRRISPSKIFYYLMGYENDVLALLGTAELNVASFQAPADGNIVIEAPEKKTFLTFDSGDLEKYFVDETTYEILPVIAYGLWSDPVGEAGLDALINTIEHAEAFAKDHAAFAGQSISFSIERAKIEAAAPPFSYLGETPQVKVVFNVPGYARQRLAGEVNLQALPPVDAAEPKVDPARLDEVTADVERPSRSRILFNDKSKEGAYQINIDGRIKGLADVFQPSPVAVVIEYAPVPNPEGGVQAGATGSEAGSDLAGLLVKMQGLEAQAQAAAQEISSLEKTFHEGVKDLTKELERAGKEMMSLAKDLSALESLANKMDDKGAEASKAADDAYNSGAKCAAARGGVEDHTTQACQLAQSIKGTDNVQQLNQFIEQLRAQDADTRSQSDIFRQELNSARMSSRQAETILRQMSSLMEDREKAKTKLWEKQNMIPEAQAQLSGLESHLTSLQGKIPQLQGIVGEASGIVGQVQAVNPDQWTKEDKKAVKEIQAAFARVSKTGTQFDAVYEKNRDKLMTPEDKLKNLEDAVAEAQGRMDSLLSFQINDEAVEKIRKFAGEAKASYEAAQLFDDAVREAVRNSEACAREAEKLYAQKTSSEAQVAQHDCSAWPGTAAKWDSAKKTPECECAPGNLWEENLFTCVSEEQYYVSRLDCSPYPNAHPGWDAGRRKASCYCNDGYEWNNARTHCRVNAQTQVAQADCSNSPGTRPGWDPAQERVGCYCPQGYYLEGNRCVMMQPQNNPTTGQDLTNALTGLINTINNAAQNSGGGNGAGTQEWTNPWNNQPSQPQGDPCEGNFYMSGYAMACGCSGYTWSTSGNKCVPGGGGSGGTSAGFGSGSPTNNQDTGGGNTGGAWVNQGYQGTGGNSGGNSGGVDTSNPGGGGGTGRDCGCIDAQGRYSTVLGTCDHNLRDYGGCRNVR